MSKFLKGNLFNVHRLYQLHHYSLCNFYPQYLSKFFFILPDYCADIRLIH